jgi:hypothetical protein
MSLGCNCEQGLSNTGVPACVPIQSVTSTLIMVPLESNAGIKNAIDLSAAVPVWADYVNEIDESKRWFPLPQFENVELPKADSQFEEANSGRMAFLRQGKRSFTGELWADDSSPTLLSKLQNNRCVEFGVYIIDVNGNLVGSQVGDRLFPIPVDNPSFNPTYMFATDSTVSKIVVAFDFDRLFDEGTMYMIQPDEAGINFNSLQGLIDVNFADFTEVANTSVTFNAEFDYGTAYNKILLKGLVAADFALYNNTTSSAEVIGSVTPNLPLEGNYTVAFVFVTGESYTLSISKTGFTGSITFTAT